MKLAFATVLLLLSIAPALHAADYLQVCTPDQLGKNGGNELIAISFMLITLAIAGAYMYGKGMSSPEAEVWARDEATNLVITVLLFAGLVAFFQGACALAQGYTGNSPFEASYQYLDRLVYNQAAPAIKFLVSESLENQKDATKYLYIGMVPYTGHGVAPDANLRALSANKEFLVDLFLPMAASLSAQKQILQVIELVASGVLLPFAFILRLIPPTREMGDMLIALFFALYIVAPTVYAMSGAAFETVVSEPMMHMATRTYLAGSPPVPQQVTEPIYDFYDFSMQGGHGTAAWLYRIGTVLPQAIFIPNLVIVIVTTCAMAMAKGLRAIQA